MIKLVTTEQIRELESAFIKKMGAGSSLALMEKAGSALANIVKEYDEPYLFICGKGNNGGDGIVAAKHLHNLGKKVHIVLTSDEASLSHNAKVNFESVKNTIPNLKITNEKDKDFLNILNSSNTVIDCLLGSGTNGKVSDFYDLLIKVINNTNKTVIACDIPTGIDPNTGNVSAHAVGADVTVTFGYPKLGLVVQPAKKFTGILKTIDIGLPDIDTKMFLLDDKFVKENLPKRAEDANKGAFGRTIVVSGSRKYPGAALLASKGASSIGSGLTSLSSPPEVFNKILPVCPEITYIDFTLGTVLEESLRSSVLVIGPGLTISDEIKDLVESLITKASVPIVLDADGLNVLAGKKEVIKKAKKDVIITPHPKEFAKLLEITVDEVLNNKIKLVQDTACELNCIVVLKGPATIIGTSDGKIYVSPFVNAALAKGGTGDVLAGFIGGLIAQGLKPDLAACVGVYIHGKSGEFVAHEKTVFSLLPQDLISYLPQALKIYIK